MLEAQRAEWDITDTSSQPHLVDNEIEIRERSKSQQETMTYIYYLCLLHSVPT